MILSPRHIDSIYIYIQSCPFPMEVNGNARVKRRSCERANARCIDERARAARSYSLRMSERSCARESTARIHHERTNSSRGPPGDLFPLFFLPGLSHASNKGTDWTGPAASGFSSNTRRARCPTTQNNGESFVSCCTGVFFFFDNSSRSISMLTKSFSRISFVPGEKTLKNVGSAGFLCQVHFYRFLEPL